MTRRRSLPSLLLAAGALALAVAAGAEPLDVAWRAPGDALDPGRAGDASSARQSLAPRASIALTLPASTPLRWRVTGGDAARLEAALAEDGDLFRAVVAEQSAGGFRWLPPVAHQRRVLLRNDGDSPLALEVWTGELFEPEAPELRVPLRAEGIAPVRWRLSPSRDIGHGAFVSAGEPLRYHVKGPARVEVESVALVNAPDAKPSWAIGTQLDDAAPRAWHLLAPVDHDQTRRFRDATRATSLPRSLFLDVPAGTHALAVSGSANTLVRVFTGRGLLFAGNLSPAFPRADDALARAQRFQDARERVVGGDPAAAGADWRALDGTAALLLARGRAAFDIEPLGDGPLAFGWSVDADTGAGARLTWLEPGRALAWQVPANVTRVTLDASGENGTRLSLARGADAPEDLLLRGDRQGDLPRGSTVLAVRGGDTLTVRADKAALVRLRGMQPRDAGLAPLPGEQGAVDLARAVTDPARAPAWFAPLAERLAGRLADTPSSSPSPCATGGDALPTDWRERAEDFAKGGRPDDAARLLARARATCTGGDDAGDRLAALLRANGEYRAFALLRLDDSERRHGAGQQRAIDELRAWYRSQESWIDLESLGARRARAGDPRAWGLVGESLAEQGESPLLDTLCDAMAAAGVRADTPLLARACAEASLQHDAAPWGAVTAIDGTAGALRTLESVTTGQRASRFLARDDAPVALRVEGPLLLRVEARRLLDLGAAEGPAGWLSVGLDHEAWRVPLDAGAASAEWRVAANRRLPGQARRFAIEIPAGVHRLELKGDGEMLFAVSAADPSWASVLPAGGTDTPLDEPALDDTDVREPPVVDDTSDRHLLRLAWWSEHSAGAKQRGYRARLHALVARQPLTPWRDRLLSRVDRDYSWQREARVIDSAGLRYADDGNGGSPSLRLRRALLGAPDGDAFAMTGAWLVHDSAPGVLVDGGAWQRVRVQARQFFLPGSAPAPAAVAVGVDDRVVSRLDAGSGDARAAEIATGAGLHRVVLRLADPQPDQYVQVRLEAFDGSHWEPLPLQGDRTFLVSRADTPVRVAVDTAEWLRIDELVDGGIRTRYQFQPVAGVAALPPVDGDDSTMRVLSLRTDPHPLPPAAPTPVAALPSLSRARAAASVAALEAPVAWTLGSDRADSPPVDRGEEVYLQGEWNADPNEGAPLRNGDRTTLGWRHRARLDRPGLWWRSDLFARALDGPQDTLGTTQLLEWRPVERPWYLQAQGEAYALHATQGGDAQSAVVTLRWRLEHDLDREFTHRVGAEAFGRWLGADATRGATIADPDVWTPWKADHRDGLRFNERWRWQPVEDAAVQLEYGLNGNESLTAHPLDSAWVEPSARLWWRGVSLDATLRWQRFLADDDRANPYETHSAGLDAQWRRWRARGGWYLEAAWRHDLDTGIDDVLVGGGWSFGAGPRSYPPSELPFRPLEQRAFDRANARDRLATDTDHAGR